MKKDIPKDVFFLARPEGFEPPAFGIGIHCDIQLRHGRIELLVSRAGTIVHYFSPVCKRKFAFSEKIRKKSEKSPVFPGLHRLSSQIIIDKTGQLAVY